MIRNDVGRKRTLYYLRTYESWVPRMKTREKGTEYLCRLTCTQLVNLDNISSGGGIDGCQSTDWSSPNHDNLLPLDVRIHSEY